MNIQGIDRAVIGVRNMDKALHFFADVLGVKFVEMGGPFFEQAGVRVCISLDKHLELISPVVPGTDVNPPDTKRLSEWLEVRGDGVLFALALKVEDPDEGEAEVRRKGIRVVGVVEEKTVPPLGIMNFKEVILNEEDTLAVKLALVGWKPME